jgi:hypothetical protein
MENEEIKTEEEVLDTVEETVETPVEETPAESSEGTA